MKLLTRLIDRIDRWLDSDDGDDLTVHEAGLEPVVDEDEPPTREPHDELMCDPCCEDWGYPCQA